MYNCSSVALLVKKSQSIIYTIHAVVISIYGVLTNKT